MRTLALDVGTRRTGVAYLDTDTGIPLPLDTLTHVSESALVDAVLEIVRTRKIDRVIVGLPLLPSGDEGAQTRVSRTIGDAIARAGVAVEYGDERYTTPGGKTHKHTVTTSEFDGDAAAACELLNGLKTGK